MSVVKSALCLVVLLATLHGVWGMLCYGFLKGKDEAPRWVFCPSTSCYTVDDKDVHGQLESRRGCADKAYPKTCQKHPGISRTDNVCFCNSILCNYSGAGTSSLALPLLLLPYVLHKFL